MEVINNIVLLERKYNEKKEELKYILTPVPVYNMLSILSTDKTRFSIQIYDIYSNLVLESTNLKSTININFVNHRKGIYIVRITDSNGLIEYLKFIKE